MEPSNKALRWCAAVEAVCAPITGTLKFKIVGVVGKDLKCDLFYVRCRNTREELTITQVGP